MKKYLFPLLATLIIVSGVIFVGCQNQANNSENAGAQEEQTNANPQAVAISARKAYEIAQTKKEKLPNDASFSFLSSMPKLASSDGLSKGWNVYFWSPSKKQSYLIKVYANKVEEPKESSDNHKEALTTDWVDSFEVAQAAKEKCAGSDDTGFVYYVYQNDEGQSRWSVVCKPDDKVVTLRIDGQTGQLIK